MAADLATVSGFAVTDPETPSRPILATIRLPAPRFEGDYAPRYTALRMHLIRWFEAHRPAVLVFEAALILGAPGLKTNVHTARLLNGMAAIAEEAAHSHGIEVGEANNAEVRRHFIGTNRGRRAELKDAVMRRCSQLGWLPKNDNEGDAAATWDFQTHLMRANRRLRPTLAMGRP